MASEDISKKWFKHTFSPCFPLCPTNPSFPGKPYIWIKYTNVEYIYPKIYYTSNTSNL